MPGTVSVPVPREIHPSRDWLSSSVFVTGSSKEQLTVSRSPLPRQDCTEILHLLASRLESVQEPERVSTSVSLYSVLMST